MLSPEEEEGGIDGRKDRKVNQFSDWLATLYTWHVQRCRWASFQGSWCSIFSADSIERYQIYVLSPTKYCGTIKCVVALNGAPVQLPCIKANLYRYTWLRICYIVWVHWQKRLLGSMAHVHWTRLEVVESSFPIACSTQTQGSLAVTVIGYWKLSSLDCNDKLGKPKQCSTWCKAMHLGLHRCFNAVAALTLHGAWPHGRMSRTVLCAQAIVCCIAQMWQFCPHIPCGKNKSDKIRWREISLKARLIYTAKL